MGHQLQMYLGLHRLVIVVHGGYVKERGVAHADGIAHRLHVDAEAAPGGKKASSPCNFAIGQIGNGGLNGVILISRPLQIGNVLRGYVDSQLAIRVEFSGLFRLLGSVVAQ
jgi:hypothetical protein